MQRYCEHDECDSIDDRDEVAHEGSVDPRLDAGGAAPDNRQLAVLGAGADEPETEEQQETLPLDVNWIDQELARPHEFWRFLLRMSFGTLMHPYEYAKILMQLGYEPMPAAISTNWLGRTTLYLPSVHQYIRYIKHIDGFSGLYRGLFSRIMSTTCYALFSESLVNMFGVRQLQKRMHPFSEYLWNLVRGGIIVVTGLAISHPFYVISVRQMAQFVGREVVYSSMKGSIEEILAQAGPLGFYAGFVPRLLSDLGILFCTSTLSAIYNQFSVFRSDRWEYNSVLIQFGAVMLFYPLQVVGACMACSGSAVAAGAPPYMPIYDKWIDCLMDLIARGDHYRGAFMFRRTLPKVHAQRAHDPFTRPM